MGVPTAMWVCTAASATNTMQVASAVSSGGSGTRKPEGSLYFILFNLAFLLVLTLVLYGAFLKYKDQVEHHVDVYMPEALKKTRKGMLPEHKVAKLRAALTRDLAYHRLDLKMKRPVGKKSVAVTVNRASTWSPSARR